MTVHRLVRVDHADDGTLTCWWQCSGCQHGRITRELALDIVRCPADHPIVEGNRLVPLTCPICDTHHRCDRCGWQGKQTLWVGNDVAAGQGLVPRNWRDHGSYGICIACNSALVSVLPHAWAHRYDLLEAGGSVVLLTINPDGLTLLV